MELPAGNEEEKSSKSSKIVLDFMTIKTYFSAMASQLSSRITVDSIRSLDMFLGVTGQNLCFSQAFTPPAKTLDKSTMEKFKSRIKLNLSFFLSNYALVAFGVALVVTLLNPGMIAWIVALVLLQNLHTFLISNELVIFGRNIGTLISISHRSTALSLIWFVVIVWKCLRPAITTIALSGILIISHAVMRDPKHIESSKTFGHKADDDDSSGESEVLVDRPVV